MNQIITDLVVTLAEATSVDITVQPGPVIEVVQPAAIYVEIGDIGGPVGPQGAQGIPGPAGPQGLPGTGFVIKGTVPTEDALPIAPAPLYMDGWVTEDTDHLWVWNGSTWVDCGDLSGPPGPTGAQGNTGETGIEGPIGPEGPGGPIGHEGPQGPQGLQGEIGYQGPIGPQGAAGLGVNFKGTVANSGALPPTGNQPNDGWVTLDTGYTWVWTGTAWINVGIIQGPVGPMGPQGIKGDQGPQGVTGIQGNPGVDGAEGPAGVPGAPGNQGSQGIPGAAGAQGPPGSTGPIGPTGETGPMGPVGTNDYADLVNVPATFPPSEHAHSQDEVAGLPEDQAAQNAAIAAKVPEAPLDGLQYARMSATWVVVEASGGSATYVGDAPPADAVPGQFWWESDTGNLLIRYDDGNSLQWVPAMSSLTQPGGGAVAGGRISIGTSPPATPSINDVWIDTT